MSVPVAVDSLTAAREVAAVAGAHAARHDREASFPAEAIAALWEADTET